MDSLYRGIALTAAAAFAFAACDDDTTSPGATSGATLSFAVAQPGAGPGTAPGAGPSMVEIVDDDGRTLDITQLQVVMEEMELERANDDDCAGDDDCEEFEEGPVLIDLPVEGGVISPFSTAIPADTYDELELEIDDADDDDGTEAFFDDNPTWPRDASVRVVGTFDDNDGSGPQAFDVYLEISAEIERALVPPLVVTDADQDVNVTVELDLAHWFVVGGSLIDPRDLDDDDDLLDDLEDRIEDSFQAFEDDDRDGDDDD